jgi:hypothetical protein
MAFPRFGFTPKGSRESALDQLPPRTEAEMKDIPGAISDARNAYRSMIVNMAERSAGGTNLNRMIQRNAADMAKALREIGLSSNNIVFPEDATPNGEKARAYLGGFAPPQHIRQMSDFAGERAIYAPGHDGLRKVVDLSPLEPWTAPDDSPASRARLARREVIDISIERDHNTRNRRYPQSRFGSPEEAVRREKAALAEIGLDPRSVRYPEDGRARDWAALEKSSNAVSWDQAAKLAPDRTFEMRDGQIREIDRPTGIADYAQKVLREADARIAARREDEFNKRTVPADRPYRTEYDKADRTHEGTRPSLAVRAAMAVAQRSR